MGGVPGPDVPGGSRALVKLIDEHGTALTADLRRYYGIDLRDLFRDGTSLTARYVLWLVEHLPEDSATFASMRGGPRFRSWTTQTHLMAAMVNLLHGANSQRAGKRSRPLVRPPKPERPKRARVASVARMAARFARSN